LVLASAQPRWALAPEGAAAALRRSIPLVRAWPSVVGRVRLSPTLLGKVALVAVLTVALGIASLDAPPATSGDLAETGSGPSGIQYLQVSGNNLSGKPMPASTLPVVEPAPPPEPLIPTAAPVQLLIPTLDVHRAVEKVGVNSSGVMNVPANAWNAGWYKGGPVPGAPGDAVIEGHAGYPGQPMIFGRLATLKPGDRVIVVLGDKSRRLFLVVSMSVIPVGTAPAGFAEPYGPPRLTLITCTGHFDKGTYSYTDRLAVQLRYAGLV
jgi:hypothetical protein